MPIDRIIRHLRGDSGNDGDEEGGDEDMVVEKQDVWGVRDSVDDLEDVVPAARTPEQATGVVETRTGQVVPSMELDDIEALRHSIANIGEIVEIPIDELRSSMLINPRIHPEEQINRLMASIRQWGWTIPVLVDEDMRVLAGHGRVEAGKQLDVEVVPCLVARGWSEAQKRAYIIADNRLAETSEWNLEKLHEQLNELMEHEFIMEAIDMRLPPHRSWIGNWQTSWTRLTLRKLLCGEEMMWGLRQWAPAVGRGH